MARNKKVSRYRYKKDHGIKCEGWKDAPSKIVDPMQGLQLSRGDSFSSSNVSQWPSRVKLPSGKYAYVTRDQYGGTQFV